MDLGQRGPGEVGQTTLAYLLNVQSLNFNPHAHQLDWDETLGSTAKWISVSKSAEVARDIS